nr:hypothetical protein [Bowdeniella nasicola]
MVEAVAPLAQLVVQVAHHFVADLAQQRIVVAVLQLVRIPLEIVELVARLGVDDELVAAAAQYALGDGEVVAVELAQDRLRPLGLLPAHDRHEGAEVNRGGRVEARDVEERRREVKQRDELVAHLRLAAGDADDAAGAVDVLVHGRALVVQTVRARELAVVGGEDDRGVVREAEPLERVEDALELAFQHRDVAPVDGDELAGLLLSHRVERPVIRVVLLNRRLVGEVLRDRFRQLDVVGIGHVEVLVGDDIRQVRAGVGGGEEEGLGAVLVVLGVALKHLARAGREMVLERRLDGLLQARGEQVMTSASCWRWTFMQLLS